MPDWSTLIAGQVGTALLLYAMLPSFPLLYVLVRWRTRGAGEPGLGTVSAILYFRAVALLVFVTGASLVVQSLLSKTPESRSMEDLRHVAYGLLLGGGVFWVVNSGMLWTGARLAGLDDAVRTFHGFVLVVSGIATLGLGTTLAVLAFRRNAEFDDLRGVLAWALVWALTWLVHVARLRMIPVRS